MSDGQKELSVESAECMRIELVARHSGDLGSEFAGYSPDGFLDG